MPHAALCFDETIRITQVRYEDHDLAFTLDTRETNTDLYPALRSGIS